MTPKCQLAGVDFPSIYILTNDAFEFVSVQAPLRGA